MSAAQDELKAMFAEADRRGDRETAIAIMDKLESLQGGDSLTIPSGPMASPDIQAQQPIEAPGPKSLAGGISAVVEPAATMVSGAIAEPVAGLAGIATLAFDDVSKATENIEAVRNALTFVPPTKEGMDSLKKVAEALQPAAELMESGEKALGEAGFEAAGPVGGAIGETAITAGLSAIGLPIVRRALSLGKERPGVPESAIDAEIRAEIPPDPTGSDKAIKNTLDGRPQVKANPRARAAIKQGMDESVASVVLGGGKSDRSAAREMVNIVEKGRENRAYFNKYRPEDVVGDTILKRWKAVRDVNKKAGEQIDNIAKKSLRGQTVDNSAATGKFLDDLEGLGVSVDENFKPVFDELSVENIPGAKTLITRVLKDLSVTGNNAFKTHKLKRLIDEQVSFGKAESGLSGKTEKAIKDLRVNLDTGLDDKFPKYNDVNTRYAESIGALNDFRDVAGAKNFNPFSVNANAFVGQISNRLLSNVASRTRLENALNQLESVAGKYGAKFDDNINTQVMIADELERMFGSFSGKSFQGRIERGIEQAGKLATESSLQTGIRLGAEGVSMVQGISDKNAIKALKKFLEER